jgi:hypothetical protein
MIDERIRNMMRQGVAFITLMEAKSMMSGDAPSNG